MDRLWWVEGGFLISVEYRKDQDGQYKQNMRPVFQTGETALIVIPISKDNPDKIIPPLLQLRMFSEVVPEYQVAPGRTLQTSCCTWHGLLLVN